MRYKQTKPYACGLYSVANACNLDNFVTDERLALSKEFGNTIGQLSRWMQDDNLPYAIDALFYDHVGTKLPDSALEYKPSGEGINFMPVLINVRFSKDGLNHLVGGKISKDGTLFLYDSLKDNVVVTTLKEVNDMYFNVYGLFILMHVIEGNYVFL